MKKIIVAVFAIVMAFATQTYAQDKASKTPEQRAEAVTKKLTNKLSLSSDQATKIQALNLESFKEVKSLREQIKGKQEKADRQAVKKQIKELRDKRQNDIKAVLNADQKAKYEAFLAEKEAKKAEKKANNGKGKAEMNGKGKAEIKGKGKSEMNGKGKSEMKGKGKAKGHGKGKARGKAKGHSK